MKEIFNDGVLQAVQYQDGWVFIRWMQNTYGRLQKKLIRDLMEIERLIYTRHLKGWVTASEFAHKEFQEIIKRVGARSHGQTADSLYFIKPINSMEDFYHV